MERISSSIEFEKMLPLENKHREKIRNWEREDESGTLLQQGEKAVLKEAQSEKCSFTMRRNNIKEILKYF